MGTFGTLEAGRAAQGAIDLMENKRPDLPWKPLPWKPARVVMDFGEEGITVTIYRLLGWWWILIVPRRWVLSRLLLRRVDIVEVEP